MKVIILNPPYGDDFCRSARWAARSRGRVQRHPETLLISAALLEKEGHAVRFIDGAALNLKQEEIRERVKEFRPELAVIHTTTPSIDNDLSYAQMIKATMPCQTVLVGPHVTAVPEETFETALGNVDLIVRGEYDFTLSDIASGENLETIEGISYLRDGAIIHHPDRKPVDVDRLPFPAWRHIRPEWYRDAGKKFPFLTLISGRGCHGRCTFCRDTQLMYGRALRLRHPEAVVDEIEYDLRLFPYLKEIMFETDTFTASKEHVTGICDQILSRGVKVTWSCNTRVDIDLSLLPLMKRAGCRMLMTGFEFGTQEALDAVQKGVTVEQSLQFSKRARQLGFVIHGCFMIGAPGETRESARATIEFAKSLPLDTVQFSGICPYPGTKIYEWAKQHGYLVAGKWSDWVDEDFEQVTLLSYPQLNKKEMDDLIDEGLRGFYLRPKQMIRMLLNVRSPEDIKRKVFGLKSFIDSQRTWLKTKFK